MPAFINKRVAFIIGPAITYNGIITFASVNNIIISAPTDLIFTISTINIILTAGIFFPIQITIAINVVVT